MKFTKFSVEEILFSFISLVGAIFAAIMVFACLVFALSITIGLGVTIADFLKSIFGL